jgi:hypothetical protein
MAGRIAFINAEGAPQKGIVTARNLEHNELTRLYCGGNWRTVNLQDVIEGFYSPVS